MKLLEPMPHTIEEKIRGFLPPEEEELIRVSTDLNRDGSFGTQWVIVTDKKILIVSPGDTNGVMQVPIAEVLAARTEPLVGGGQLEIERKAGATALVPYSNSLAVKFSEVTRGIEQLRKGEPFLINPELDRIRCEKCGRLLPEKNGICPACLRRLTTLRRIGGYLKPYKWRAILLAAVSLAGTFAELLPPMVTRHIVDNVLVLKEGTTVGMAERVTLLSLLVLALIGARTLSWGAEWAHGWTVTWLGARITADIRSELYRRLELLSLQFYDKRQVGAVMSRVTRDAGRLQDFLVEGLPYLIINGLMVIGIFGFLFLMSWRLTLYILLPIPLMLAWGVLFWRRMRRYFHKWDQAWSNLMAMVNEALSGIRVVKAFAQEIRELAAFNKRNKVLRQISVRTEINWEIFFATSSFVTGLGVLIIWFFGGLEDAVGEPKSSG